MGVLSGSYQAINPYDVNSWLEPRFQGCACVAGLLVETAEFPLRILTQKIVRSLADQARVPATHAIKPEYCPSAGGLIATIFFFLKPGQMLAGFLFPARILFALHQSFPITDGVGQQPGTFIKQGQIEQGRAVGWVLF